MLRKHCAILKPDFVAIAEPKVIFDSISSHYWSSLGLSLLGINSRAHGIPNLWVFAEAQYRNSSVVLATSQVIVIKVNMRSIDVLLAFIHADSDYIPRRDLWSDLLEIGRAHV